MQAKWPPVTNNFKGLAIVLFTLWMLSLGGAPLHGFFQNYMLVSYDAVVRDLQVWTVLTYALWHADFMHLLFNLAVLWMFGGALDARWSRLRWWRFNALCALGGGVAVVASQAILQTSYPTLGYSGAVMGVVAAFAWNNWNRTIYLFFVPMKGKMILPVLVVLDILIVVVGREPISIAGHLGGMLTGLVIVTGWWRPRRFLAAWRRFKHRRKRKKFDVVRRDPESDDYVN